ncbi:hypothetical protein JCM15765_10150 [Paradesulfitobacterium aromaticivorans]
MDNLRFISYVNLESGKSKFRAKTIRIKIKLTILGIKTILGDLSLSLIQTPPFFPHIIP